jgi:starvation-inducible DNA-binding protein
MTDKPGNGRNEGVDMPRTTFYGQTSLPVTIHPNIGLEASVRQSVIKMLNLILADETVLTIQTHRVNGHAIGMEIENLKKLFDIQNQQIQAISAEIAERIQILGGSPPVTEEELINLARLDGGRNAISDLVDLLSSHEALTRFLREDIQKCSEIYEDQGTAALLVNVMRLHEKMDWMLRSNITSEKLQNE